MQCCKSTTDQQNNNSITVLLVGLDDAGKTTVLEYLLRSENRPVLGNVTPTVQLSVSRLKCRRTQTVIHAYDFGGRADIRYIWEQYYHKADGIVYVIDCSNKDRFDESKHELLKILKHPEIEQKPILVLANKVDQNPYYEDCDFIEDLEIEDLVNEIRCPTCVRECSALRDPIDRKRCKYAIGQAFVWLVNAIRYREHAMAETGTSAASTTDSTSRLLHSQPNVVSKWKRYFCRRNKTAPDNHIESRTTMVTSRRPSTTPDWALVN